MELNDRRLKYLFLVFIAVSIVHVIYATITLRGFYEDGVFYFFNLLNFFSDNTFGFAYDFTGHPRSLVPILYQLPTVLTNHLLSIHNKQFLSYIFCITQFLFPLLGLWWNYKLTLRTKRFDIFYFSMFTYCAIITLYMIFSVTESIIGIPLQFVLLNYLAGNIKYTKKDILAIVFLVIMQFGIYEYIIFLGPILFAASLFYAGKTEDKTEKITKYFIGIGSFLAGIYSFLFMLQAPNELHEVQGFFKETFDYMPQALNLNSLLTITAIIISIYVLFRKTPLKNSQIIGFTTLFGLLLIRMWNNLEVYLTPMWEQHMRSIPCWFVPLVFLFVFILDFTKKKIPMVVISNLMIVTLMCGISQTIWQMTDTYFWNKNINYLKNELANCQERIYVPSEHEEISSFHNKDLRRFIWHGVYAATSLMLSDSYEQKTLLMNYDTITDDGNNPFREALYVGKDFISIPYSTKVPIKNKYWDLTECAKAVDKYNKEHNISTFE